MGEEVLSRPAITETIDDWPEEKKQSALRILIKHRELIQSLTFRDIRSRYKQSILGIAWALLTPVAMTIVFYIIFTYIAPIDTGRIPKLPFYYTAMLPWTFFSGGIAAATECLVSNFNLITKIYFPREAFPISAILGKGVDLALGLMILIPLYFFYHVHVTWYMLLVIPVLVVQLSFTLGLAFLLSSINLFYRDIRHVVPLMMTVWMYMTPVFFEFSRVPQNYALLYAIINPMAPIIQTYRDLALKGEPPMWGYIGIAAALSLVTLVVGYRVFKKLEPAFAETI